MPLSDEQRASLRRDGYVVLPGAIPPAAVDRALAAINGSLGSGGLPPERLPEFRARSFCPELVDAPALLDLFRATPVGAVAEAALGSVVSPTRAQIALRFPGHPAGAAVPHIDGVYSPNNGVAPDTLAHFTALAGVFLSDAPADARGNLTVWPGSHLAVAERARTAGIASIARGFPLDLPLGSPRALHVRAGDAVLAHYLLAHGIAPNHGPHVRYAVFFRLYHQQHAAYGDRPVTDPWLEWPGVR